jgi:choline-glycine betaine transporter
MTKRTICFFTVVTSLGFTGLASGFMVALLQGLQANDWGYMAIYVVIVPSGLYVVAKVLRDGIRTISRLDKINNTKEM